MPVWTASGPCAASRAGDFSTEPFPSSQLLRAKRRGYLFEEAPEQAGEREISTLFLIKL
jgi:hypothetical protein